MVQRSISDIRFQPQTSRPLAVADFFVGPAAGDIMTQ